MFKWSTAQAAIFKNTVWKQQRKKKKKLDAEILKTSDLSNKIISSSAKSRETIPLKEETRQFFKNIIVLLKGQCY